MPKIGFTKLGLKPNNEIQTIEFNEQTIEVKQYLPVEEKLELITNVLELSHDSNNFGCFEKSIEPFESIKHVNPISCTFGNNSVRNSA